VKNQATPPQPILVYQTEDGRIRVDVHMDADAVWLSQDQTAMLFGKGLDSCRLTLKEAT
jgi:hypothetical protein